MRSNCFLLLFVVLTACDNPQGEERKNTQMPEETPPVAGSLVAADSMRIIEDKLNHFWFSVLITASETAAAGKGVYDIRAVFGNAVAASSFSMPKGGESLKPLLRRDSGYSFTIGFVPGVAFGGDTAFHEYYRITGSRAEIKIAALKGFSIQ